MDYDRIAGYYDRYVKFDDDIPFFLREIRRVCGEVLELMSGTGRLSLHLIQSGARLTCVDCSEAMLGILRGKLEDRGLPGDVIRQDIRRLSLGKKFDLVIIPFHSFAELASPADQLATLAGVYEHLSHEGRFICTLHNPTVRLKSVTDRLHLVSRNITAGSRLLVWSAEKYNPSDGTVEGVQLYEEYDERGVMILKTMMELKFRLIAKEQFENMALSSGFEVLNLYGDYSFSAFDEESSPVMIFEMRRQA